MSRRAVHFDSIQIHRALGISQGEGFTLTDLSPGVNLIHGPNGSGKSTTARVIQELLWAGHTGLERPTVSGQFQDGQTEWEVDIDAGYVQTACQGQSGIVPDLGPPENRHRYHLALHELIAADNADFAKAITEASQGGYDLDSAAGALGYSERPSSPRKQSSQLKVAQDKVKDALRHQQGIDQAASQLPELRKDREQAVEAEDKIRLLEKAAEYLKAKDTCRTLQSRLNALPQGLALLRGDERESLDQLVDRQNKLEGSLKAERENIKDSEDALAQSNLPDEGVDKTVIINLRSWQRKLKDTESTLHLTQQQLTKAETQASAARKRLGNTLTHDPPALIDTLEVGELNAFARQADQFRARQAVLAEQKHWLECEEPEEIQGLKATQLQDGITALSQWLASPVPVTVSPTGLGWPILLASILIAVLGSLLTFLHHWAWSVTLLPAVAFVIWEMKRLRSSVDNGQTDARAVHQHSYENTGLASPQAWDTQAVASQVRDLVRLAGVLAREDERCRRLRALEPETQAMNRLRDSLDQQRNALEQKLGIHLDMTDAWLPLVVDNISVWQRSQDEVKGCKTVLEELEREQGNLVDQINKALGPFGYDNIELADQASQWIDDLADRQAQYSAAVKARDDSTRRIENVIEPDLQTVKKQQQGILDRLGIKASDDPVLDDWLAQMPDYRSLKQALASAEAIQKDRTLSLAGHEALLKLNLDEIQRDIKQLKVIAEKREALITKMAQIERDIETAKAGHEVSEALEACEAAADALADARDRSAEAVTGALLTKWVRTVAIERARPQVFSRANELFIQFTQGTLKLDLDDQASPPRFRACQGASVPRPVDQLSVGERVQLLMAVRVAFLEQDEPTCLPLLLDETLGTSDDMRVGVIIDAMIEIARQGRQVFYFTAQHDEVGKWISRLTERDAPHKVIDLAQVRHLSQAAVSPLQIARVHVLQPPAPDDMSHDQYGEALGVPNINPALENQDRLHLWHLIEDITLLYRLLCLQITTWSQLQTLLDHRSAGLVDMSDAQIEQIRAAARAIEAACRAWRVGRGKPVDCQGLQDSGCVTDRFIGELRGLAQHVGGDAQAMIQALERREVSGWQSKNTEGLREYFEENGYISTETPLSPEAIRLQVLAAVEQDLKTHRIEVSLIDRVLGSLP
ncbi:MAG: hypothetical protein K9N55_12290 [Phycisphaerae bacterium]|nr:hypothetical protein [Phycisphaerae bacterium]